jgi:CDP-paratose 2-epimerase
VRLLVTGGAGFVGSTLIRGLLSSREGLEVVAFDNLSRPGSEANRRSLTADGVQVVHGDLRQPSDLDALPEVDAVIDAAALPSVLGGVADDRSARQVVEHNLVGTLNLLERCRRDGAPLVLLSTSRVYSIPAVGGLALQDDGEAFRPDPHQPFPTGIGPEGIDETCSTRPPVSLYGSTKLASEQLALEYGSAFGFPVWVDRCGVLTGPGQFGTAEQGIFSFWVHAHRAGRPLAYLGFGGRGMQVRDGLHPVDLVPLIGAQLDAGDPGGRPQVVNAAGGTANSMSLRQLTAWCADRLGAVPIEERDEERPYDLPWVVLDPALAGEVWDWRPQTPLPDVLEAIARHAEAHPDWLNEVGA